MRVPSLAEHAEEAALLPGEAEGRTSWEVGVRRSVGREGQEGERALGEAGARTPWARAADVGEGTHTPKLQEGQVVDSRCLPSSEEEEEVPLA